MKYETFRKWLKKVRRDPTAQELYYRQVENQATAAAEAVKFMIEATRRGYKMRLHIEVDGVFCPSGDILMEREQGKALSEYVCNWLAGVAWVYSEELVEMRRLWPDIAGIEMPAKTPAIYGRGGGGPENVSNGP
jgi:hypothetical protein